MQAKDQLGYTHGPTGPRSFRGIGQVGMSQVPASRKLQPIPACTPRWGRFRGPQVVSLDQGTPPTLLLGPLPSTCQVIPPATRLRVQDRRCLMSPAPGREVAPMPEEGEPTQRRQMVRTTMSCPGSRARRHSRPSWRPSACGLRPWIEAGRGCCWADTPPPPAHVLTARGLVQTTRPLRVGVAVGAPSSWGQAGDLAAGGSASKAQIPRLPRLRPLGSAGAGGAGEGSLKSPAALPAGSQNTGSAKPPSQRCLRLGPRDQGLRAGALHSRPDMGPMRPGGPRLWPHQCWHASPDGSP